MAKASLYKKSSKSRDGKYTQRESVFVALHLIGLLFFQSCANLKSTNKEKSQSAPFGVAPSSTTTSADKPKNHDRSRIMGSAKIDEDHEGKTYFLYGAEQLELDNYYFDIPVVYNESVKVWIDYFLNRGRDYFENYSARAGRYAPVMGKILEENGLPRDLIFLAMAESGFQNTAKSWAHAVGPWQFMPYTGKRYGLKIDWYVDERRDPIKATIAAANYLKKLYNDFGAWELAAAAYNAGEGKVSKAIRKYNSENFWQLRRGRYLKSETKNYVPKIMALAIIGKNLKAFGLENIDFHEPLDFEEIEVPPSTDLELLAKDLDIDFEELHRLNPELMRWFIPPNVDSYVLRVPVGVKEKWQDCCKAGNYVATEFQRYSIMRSGTTLSDVARKYKVRPYVLEQLNDLTEKKGLKKGDQVVLPFRVNHSIKHSMYADLYERPRKAVVRRRNYQGRIRMAKKRGRRITNPKEYYVVKKGDTLWDVARKTGADLDTLINSNINIINNRMIRAGDRLVVR